MNLYHFIYEKNCRKIFHLKIFGIYFSVQNFIWNTNSSVYELNENENYIYFIIVHSIKYLIYIKIEQMKKGWWEMCTKFSTNMCEIFLVYVLMKTK